MRLKTGHSFNANDIFKKFNNDYITTDYKTLKKYYKTFEKRVVARSVFIYAYYLIILDIIENNSIFVLPSTKDARLQMKTFSDESFRTARKNGKFQDVDILKSNFMGHQLEFYFKRKGYYEHKPIYVNTRLKNKITENTNKGIIKPTTIKKTEDFIDLVHSKFNHLTKLEISRIICYGFRNYQILNNYSADVTITERNGLKFSAYTGCMFKSFEAYYAYAIKKYTTKHRILYERSKKKWDGYYYFGLSDTYYEFYKSQEDDEIKIFENIYFFKIYDELKEYLNLKHHFKVKFPEEKGYKFKLENYETADAIEL